MLSSTIIQGTLDDAKIVFQSDINENKRQFLDSIAAFLKSRDSRIKSNKDIFIPIIHDRYLDLYELYNKVSKYGGFDSLNLQSNKWIEVVSALGYTARSSEELIEMIKTIKNAYEVLLYQLELVMKSLSFAEEKSKRTKVENTTLNSPVNSNSNAAPIIANDSTKPNASNMTKTSNIASTSNQRRSLAPVTTSNVTLSASDYYMAQIDASVQDLYSTNPSDIVRGLNFLTQKSFEFVDTSSIQLEFLPQILLGLSDLLDIINPIGKCFFEEVVDPQDMSKPWVTRLYSSKNEALKLITTVIDDSPFLATILNIIRNFSLEACNEVLMGNCVTILKHVIVVAHVALYAPTLTECTSCALEILVNLGSRISLSPRHRLCSLNQWIEMHETPSEYAPQSKIYQRYYLKVLLTETFLYSDVSQYPNVAESLLGFVLIALRSSTNRLLVYRCLEILNKLSYVPENASVLANAPNELFETLIVLLCVSVTSAESFQYHDLISTASLPTANLHGSMNSVIGNSAFSASLNYPKIALVLRPPPVVGSGFFTDSSDIDIRDLVLDVISTMSYISEKLQLRFLQVPNAIRILIAISDLGTAKIRTDGMTKSLNIITTLISNLNYIKYFIPFQAKLVTMALNDDAIAELLNAPSTYHLREYTEILGPIYETSSNTMLMDIDG